MNNFIVNIAMTFITIFFILQFVVDQTNHKHRADFNNVVEASVQDARKEGYFTPEIIDELKTDISKKLYVSENEIDVQVTTTPKYRTNVYNPSELIEYKISVPTKKIVAMAGFFGIDESQNTKPYSISGKVSSERLAER